MRVCTIPSTSFTIKHRPITSLTSSVRPSRTLRATFLPLQRRSIQNEAVQAERDADEADGAERSETGENSISEEFEAESQEYEHGIPPPASSQDSTVPSSTVEAMADEAAPEAPSPAESATSAAENLLFEHGDQSSDSGQPFNSGHFVQNIPQSSTVYLGNINFDSTVTEITKFVESAGKIEDVNIVKDARGYSRGFVTRAIEHIVGYDWIC